MAIRSNGEIFYDTPVSWIEHKTGKKVKSWFRPAYNFNVEIIFTDGTFLRIREGEVLDGNFNFEPIPKQYCASCGEESHLGFFDSFGRCNVSITRFWNKARKVFWHRYLKLKKT